MEVDEELVGEHYKRHVLRLVLEMVISLLRRKNKFQKGRVKIELCRKR